MIPVDLPLNSKQRIEQLSVVRDVYAEVTSRLNPAELAAYVVSRLVCSRCSAPLYPAVFIGGKFTVFDQDTLTFLYCPSCGGARSLGHGEGRIPQELLDMVRAGETS